MQLLERHGFVNNKDGCGSIISSIGRDIVNQKHYRTRRRKEIFRFVSQNRNVLNSFDSDFCSRLKNTLTSLEAKHEFYSDQVNYYNQYLKQCLAHQHTEGKKKKVRFVRSGNGSQLSTGKPYPETVGYILDFLLNPLLLDNRKRRPQETEIQIGPEVLRLEVV